MRHPPIEDGPNLQQQVTTESSMTVMLLQNNVSYGNNNNNVPKEPPATIEDEYRQQCNSKNFELHGSRPRLNVFSLPYAGESGGKQWENQCACNLRINEPLRVRLFRFTGSAMEKPVQFQNEFASSTRPKTCFRLSSFPNFRLSENFSIIYKSKEETLITANHKMGVSAFLAHKSPSLG